jgi:hypothetical protein
VADHADAVDDELVELVRAGLSDMLAARALQAAVDELDDEDLARFADEMRVAFGGGPGVTDAFGNTRGVRANPSTGNPERF